MGYYRWIFGAVNVMELPPFNNAFKCLHSIRFRSMREEAKRHGSPWDHHDQQEIGRRFLETLSAEDRASCPYHQADWVAIANESVRILDELGRQDERVYEEAARNSGLGNNDRRWLVSLFVCPIRIEEGSYGDGQHRGCALRFSGAAQVAAVVQTEWMGEP
jgi:hypothetical protein